MKENRHYYEIKKDCSQKEVTKSKIIATLNQIIGAAKDDIQVMIEPLKKKRSGQQLKGYWVLVKAIQVWMIEQGNLYLEKQGNIYNLSNIEELSDYIKIEAGFFTKEKIEVKKIDKLSIFQAENKYTQERLIYSNGYGSILKTPKSIANNSDCTREDMKKIIDWILAFAAEFEIVDCYIQDTELDKLLKFYEGK